MNTLSEVVSSLGGYEAVGRICGVSGKAVMKWVKRNRLPRTEWTGETHYADLMAAASGGKVSRHDLRPDLYPAEEAA